MRISQKLNGLYIYLLSFFAFLNPARVFADELQVGDNLGFAIPSFGGIITFIIRFFFVMAGLAALLYLLLGAFSWITSGGNKENVEKARDKIQAAIVGIILVVIVVAILATLEQVVFAQKLCFGLTCDVSIPALLQ
ncbi:MAG: hypothetical protein ABH812_01525 [bacterium]